MSSFRKQLLRGVRGLLPTRHIFVARVQWVLHPVPFRSYAFVTRSALMLFTLAHGILDRGGLGRAWPSGVCPESVLLQRQAPLSLP